jgi:hypothetical protein
MDYFKGLGRVPWYHIVIGAELEGGASAPSMSWHRHLNKHQRSNVRRAQRSVG